MSKECFKALLFCLRCNQEAIHNIKYSNKVIVRICCEGCGKTLGQDWKIAVNPLPKNLIHKRTLTSCTPVSNIAHSNECIKPEISLTTPPFQIYCKLILSRITTKPSRLNQEIHRDVTTFLCSIPIRFMTKPARIAKEFSTLKNTLHKL